MNSIILFRSHLVTIVDFLNVLCFGSSSVSCIFTLKIIYLNFFSLYLEVRILNLESDAEVRFVYMAVKRHSDANIIISAVLNYRIQGHFFLYC